MKRNSDHSLSHPHPAPRPRRGAFTLMELLVVIGMIALLFSLLLPALNYVRKQGDRTRSGAMLASLATALDNYLQDFGDIPRFEVGAVDPLNSADDRGARLLARAILGVAPATTEPDLDATDPRFLFQDGHGTPENPIGFKDKRQTVTRDGESADFYPGPVHEPYIAADRFEVRKTTDPVLLGEGYVYGPDAVFLDPIDQKPILYYPALARQPAINDASTIFDDGGAYIAKWTPATPPKSLYNASDNIGEFEDIDPRDAAADADHPIRFFFRELMGDLNQNGVVDVYNDAGAAVAPGDGIAEIPITQPYLLISVGVSGNYYQDPVTNFVYSLPERFPRAAP